MNPAGGVGVLGVGVHLPPAVRRNDAWSAPVVAGWADAQARRMAAVRAAPPLATAGGRAAVAAMLADADDPFEGGVERHILAADATATDMEAAAATAALAAAGVEPGEIDLVLAHSAVPEYLLSNPACELHHRLGLAPACLTVEVQASAYSFLAQLALAAPMIASGRARRALLVQSTAVSRLLPADDQVAARIGDAATAVVVGPVGPGHGVLGDFHRTDGSHPRTLIASVPGGRWYDGRSIMHVGDADGARHSFAGSVDQGGEAIAGALAAAGLTAADVGLLAVHHATAWIGEVMRRHAGLDRARTIDLYPRTGYVFSTSIPLALAAAVETGALADGDVAVLVAAGTGMVYGATVLRWGRGRS